MDAMIDWVEPAAHIATVGVLFISIWTLSRNSFDSMFTQLLANHNSIYEKVSAEYFHKFYEEFQKEFKCSNLIQANEIRTFYGDSHRIKKIILIIPICRHISNLYTMK